MLETLLLVVPCLLGIFISAWLWRIRGDEIRIEDGWRIVTPLGRFWWDRESACLRLELSGRAPATVALGAEAPRVSIVPDMEEAVASEALLSLVGVTDFGVTDLLPRYRDKVKSAAIVLEAGSVRVPFVVLKQYHAYDIFDSLGTGNSALRSLLSGLRLYRDIESVAEARAFEIADSLRKSGLNVA
jgi:hypothetical protein